MDTIHSRGRLLGKPAVGIRLPHRPGLPHVTAWTLIEGDGPVVATALHHGHDVRPDVDRLLALSPDDRRREEDPLTGRWTALAATRVVVHRSRFEVDLNRPREQAIYDGPAEAWGFQVWNGALPGHVRSESLRLYDTFYSTLEEVLRRVSRVWGRFVVYDLHTYNHRRSGPWAPPDPQDGNPDVNLGTGSMDRARWAPVVDAFRDSLSSTEVLGRRLDVRENVRFQGGHLSAWVHESFPIAGCALAVDVKKFFMDEWTGCADLEAVCAVGAALAATVRPVLEALERT